MLADTWQERDFPVLCAIVQLSDEGLRDMDAPQVAARAGLDIETTLIALFALAAERPPLFRYEDDSDFETRSMCLIREPSGDARRIVGTWPSPQTLADRLTEAMAEAAEHEQDDETRSRLRRLATWLGSAGRDILVDVTATALAKGTGVS